MKTHSIQRHHSSASNPKWGNQHIRSDTRAKSHNAHTSNIVYSIGSLTKWGQQASVAPSLLERSTPALT